MSVKIHIGDCREVMKGMAAGSVHMVATSPPYYQLRSYLGFDHPDKASEIGSESTLQEYIDTIVEVMRGTWRVLRDDGILFLNLGDSYANDAKWGGSSGGKNYTSANGGYPREKKCTGLKAKDLIGIPWRVALALQADGWYLRSAMPWVKLNPLPESVKDRVTTAHEYIFMFSKSKKYFYDSLAVQKKTVDTEAVKEYNKGNHNRRIVHENVQQMQIGENGGFFLEEQESEERAEFVVQKMSSGICKSVGANREREGIEKKIGSEIQNQRTRACQTVGIQQDVRGNEAGEKSVGANRESKRVSCSISKISQAQSCGKAVLRKRERQGGNRPLSPNAEGQGVSIARSTQETIPHDDNAVNPDSRRVGVYQGIAGEQVRDMQDGSAESDEGSHYPVEQGRSAHQGKHSGALPELQQQEGQQVELSAGRNRRTSDTFYESLDIRIEQQRAYLAHLEHVRANGGMLLSEDGSPAALLVNTASYSGAHFATFPLKLVRPLIACGTSEKGCCPECGSPWMRVVERTKYTPPVVDTGVRNVDESRGDKTRKLSGREYNEQAKSKTTGWKPSCQCNAGDPIPATVFDPFMGAGTTLLQADRMGRDAIGIELNEAYARDLAYNRIARDAPMFADVEIA